MKKRDSNLPIDSMDFTIVDNPSEKNLPNVAIDNSISIKNITIYKSSIQYLIKTSSLLCVTDYIGILNTITAAAIIARIDDKAASASLLIAMMKNYSNPLSGSFLTPSSIMMSKKFGKLNYHKVGSILQQTWLAGIIVGLPMTLFFQSTMPKTILINVLGQSPELSSIAASYFVPYSFSIIPQSWLTADANFLQATAKKKALLFWDVFDTITNISLHYILINGKLGMPKLGIAGAGYATSVQACLSVLARRLNYLLDKKFQPYALYSIRSQANFSYLKQFFKLGIPGAIQTFINNIIFNMLSPMIGRLGGDRLILEDTAYTYLNLVMPLFSGVKKTISRETANLIGNKHYSEIKLLGNAGMLTQVGIGLLPLLGLAAFPLQLTKLYIGDEVFNGIEETENFLRFAFVSSISASILWTIVETSDSMLQSFGDTWLPSLYSTLIMVSCLLPTSYLMGFVFEWDLIGLNLAAGISYGLISLCNIYRWNSHVHTGEIQNQDVHSLTYNSNSFFKHVKSFNTVNSVIEEVAENQYAKQTALRSPEM